MIACAQVKCETLPAYPRKLLVAATRVFVNEHYEDTDLLREYNDRVKRDFSEAPLHRFLQDLRNYTLHYRLPATRAAGGALR